MIIKGLSGVAVVAALLVGEAVPSLPPSRGPPSWKSPLPTHPGTGGP